MIEFIFLLILMLNFISAIVGAATFLVSLDWPQSHKFVVGMFIFPGYLLGFYFVKLLLTPVRRK